MQLPIIKINCLYFQLKWNFHHDSASNYLNVDHNVGKLLYVVLLLTAKYLFLIFIGTPLAICFVEARVFRSTLATVAFCCAISFIYTCSYLVESRDVDLLSEDPLVSDHMSLSMEACKKHHLNCKTYEINKENFHGLQKIFKTMKVFFYAVFIIKFIYSMQLCGLSCSHLKATSYSIASQKFLSAPIFKDFKGFSLTSKILSLEFFAKNQETKDDL